MRYGLLHFVVLVATCIVWSMSGGAALAQIRASINQGFETPTKASLNPATEIYQDWGTAWAVPQSVVPGWKSTHPATCFGEPCIEMWQGNAHTGNQFIELDAYQPSAAILENVCLINGEQLGWSFWHRNRSGGPDEVRFQIGNGTQILANQNTASTTVWAQNTSTATVTVPTGLHDLQFVSILPGGTSSVGNFLDDIEITLTPLLEFSLTDFSDYEGGSATPSITVSGEIPTGGLTVPVSVVPGGTTASPSDYTVASSVFIPAGVYDGGAGSVFGVAFSMNTDSDIEGDETVELTFGSGAGYEIAPISCTGAAKQSATYTILDDDARITLNKTIVNTGGGDITDETTWTLAFAGGAAGSGSGVEGDPAITTALINNGTFTLTESGGPARYTLTDLSCSGAADTSTTVASPSIDIDPGELVTCTYTNSFAPTYSFTVIKSYLSGPTLTGGASATIVDAGDTITYNILVTNTGNHTLTPLALSDSLPGATIVCPTSGNNTIAALAVSTSETCVATYALTQSDFDTNGGGDIDNIASATTTNPFGTFTDSDTETVPITPTPNLVMTKESDDTTNVVAGQVVTYTYRVTNIGNVTVDGVTVSDVSNGAGTDPVPAGETLSTTGGVPVSPTTIDTTSDGSWDALGPGDSVSFTGSYTVTQNDVDTLN